MDQNVSKIWGRHGRGVGGFGAGGCGGFALPLAFAGPPGSAAADLARDFALAGSSPNDSDNGRTRFPGITKYTQEVG